MRINSCNRAPETTLAFVVALLLQLLCGCASHNKYDDLQHTLSEFIDGKDANIGVAVIIDSKDTVAVNGNNAFPMLSVYKFPIALALADEYRKNGLTHEHPIKILPEDLHLGTWSPMTEKLLSSSETATDTLKLPTAELLMYMLQQSDNNASDIILKAIGGAESVDRYLNRIGVNGISVRNTESEMHDDNSLCCANSSTPLAMAELMDRFEQDVDDTLSRKIKQLMETCATGTARLPKPFLPTNTIIGHKTGTGFTLPNGRLMAVNDAGYVHLPNGSRYTIAVFIENSGYDMEKTEALIAEISEIVFNRLSTPHLTDF